MNLVINIQEYDSLVEKIRELIAVEKPMKMNYREAFSWQLGWSEGYKAAMEEKYENKKN